MILRALWLGLLLGVVIAGPFVAQQPVVGNNPLVERVGDTGFLQLEAGSFRQLDVRHQALAYWLTRASIAIDPIVYDQLSSYGTREKRMLAEIVAHPAGIPPEEFEASRR